jgi:hypothetical protein
VSPGGSGTALEAVSGREGTFNMCSFWLVEAFTGAGRTDLARQEVARFLFDEIPPRIWGKRCGAVVRL